MTHGTHGTQGRDRRPGRYGRHGWGPAPHQEQGGGRRPPHWWPQDEPWPPPGPPWRRAPRRFRRRFVLAAFAVLGLLVGTGIVLGLLFGPGGGRVGRGERVDHQRRAPGVAIIAGVAIVGVAATALAYRRISGPVGDLLGAAERVSVGDYDVRLEPDGPRELRMLTTTFNDMAARLAGAEAQRRRFLADITHELRTPLAVLQSGIEAQIDGIHARDDEHLASLLEEAQRLGRLIDDLHTLALADAGRIVLHRERVHPATLVEEAVAGHAALAERKGVRLVTAIAPALAPGVAPTTTELEIEVDPTRIHQVLDNLLSNAVRHTPAGGEVRATLDEAAPVDPADRRRWVRVTVVDTGPGFPADAVDQVFERFTRTADSRGSGLGLSIARDLIEAHGGTIRAWNEAGRGGAGVGFTLPATPVP